MESLIKAIHAELAETFEALRKERGWSNQKLGDLAFSEIRTSSKDKVLGLLSGKREHWTINDIVRMSEAFGKEPGSILTICIHNAHLKLTSK